ncbi:hypothetical protein G9A89_015827 [Geosiphon pyriformis]|nr:hypothetical protein G9A89_015827 [Geosiphon pyriformis]
MSYQSGVGGHYNHHYSYQSSFPRYGGLGSQRGTGINTEELFELLEWIGNRTRWTNYVYLILIVWDTDKHQNFRTSPKFDMEYEQVLESLHELLSGDGATRLQYNHALQIFENYQKFWKNNEDNLRKPSLESAYQQIGLSTDASYEEGAVLRDQLRRLTLEQRKKVRNLIIKRIQSYASFACYLQHLSQMGNTKEQVEGIASVVSSKLSVNHSTVEKITKTNLHSPNDRNDVAELNNQIAELQKRNKKLSNSLAEADEKLDTAQEQMTILKEEASHYQAALGNAISVRWRDNDPNNPVNLGEDIEKLIHSLGNFAKVKGSSIKIIEDAASQLLANYKCQTEITDKRGGKLVLHAALQLLILQTILNGCRNYLNKSPHKNQENDQASKLCDATATQELSNEWVDASHSDSSEEDSVDSSTGPPIKKQSSKTMENNLEVDIITTTDDLLDLMTWFSKTRNGTDDFTPIASIKLRQLVYAALGARGFNDIKHPLIMNLVGKLIEIMDTHRVVVGEQKKQDIKAEAIDLVLDVIQLFFFRLKSQPIIPEYRFIGPGPDLNSEFMEGNWEDINQSEVEICYFPLIGINLQSNERRVFTKARVLVRPKTENLEPSSDLKDLVVEKIADELN